MFILICLTSFASSHTQHLDTLHKSRLTYVVHCVDHMVVNRSTNRQLEALKLRIVDQLGCVSLREKAGAAEGTGYSYRDQAFGVFLKSLDLLFGNA